MHCREHFSESVHVDAARSASRTDTACSIPLWLNGESMKVDSCGRIYMCVCVCVCVCT